MTQTEYDEVLYQKLSCNQIIGCHTIDSPLSKYLTIAASQVSKLPTVDLPTRKPN